MTSKTYEEFVAERQWDKISVYRAALKIFKRMSYLMALLDALIGGIILTAYHAWQTGWHFDAAYGLLAIAVWFITYLAIGYIYTVRREIKNRKGWQKAFEATGVRSLKDELQEK